MSMRNKLIIFFSLALAALGFTIPTDWLAMMVSENGELFIPVSSGSEDPFVIKLALASYSLSFIYSSISFTLNRGVRFIPVAYLVNCIFYLLCIFLISLDSSILGAAAYGNWVPVSQVIFWFISVIAISWATFNKLRQQGAVSHASA